MLAAQQQRQHVRLIVNQAARPGDGKNITAQLQQVLNRFVGQAKPALGVAATPGRAIRLIHMGDIPADQAVKDAVMRRQLLMLHAPGSPAAVALGLIAGRLQDTVIMPDRL